MILDTTLRSLSDGDSAIHLTKQETKVMVALAGGDIVSIERLIFAIYAGDESDSAERVVWMVLHRIRRKVRDAGWEPLVLNHYGQGYFLQRAINVLRRVPPVMIPNEHRAALESLLYSHPNRAAADRVLASFVGR